MKHDAGNLFNFISFTHKFQQIKRTIFATGEDRNENDAEHSFQLALVGWYLVETDQYSLDVSKVIKYALVHDLVEVYAGDTPYYASDQEKGTKEKREQEALQTINNNFPEFSELFEFIQLYQSKSDPEARFIYALDKIIPVINIYLDQGRSWQRDKITYEMIRTKDEKIALSDEGKLIWDKVIAIMEKNLALFYTNPAIHAI